MAIDEIAKVMYYCWMDWYWVVEKWEQARGMISLGNKWVSRYMHIWACNKGRQL